MFSDVLPPPAPSRMFVVTVFAIAIAVGVLVAYFGITGHIGGPIP